MINFWVRNVCARKNLPRTTRSIALVLLLIIINKAYPIKRQLSFVRVWVENFPAYTAVYLLDHQLESCLYVGGVFCGCFHKEEPVLFSKALAFIDTHCPYVVQVKFISHKHSCNSCIRMSCRRTHKGWEKGLWLFCKQEVAKL